MTIKNMNFFVYFVIRKKEKKKMRAIVTTKEDRDFSQRKVVFYLKSSNHETRVITQNTPAP